MSRYFEISQTMNKRRRGPDDHGLLSNENGHALMEVEANESKKVRLEHMPEAPPSKVLHLRNVPNEATESDIALLGVPFGRIHNMVYAKKNNQALIEMDTIDDAVAMVSYYNSHPPQMYNRTVIIQYSNHARLETKTSNAAVEAALEVANQMESSEGRYPDDQTVLRVIVENVYGHAINHLVLYKIFQRYGMVLRIVIFTRNGQFQALIELDSPQSAHVAKLHLNGQNIYTGCCTLHIDFSKTQHLDVRQNTDKARDFTRSPLSDVERAALNAPPLGAASSLAYAQQASSLVGASSGLGGGYQHQQQHHHQAAQPIPLLAQISNLASGGGLQFKPTQTASILTMNTMRPSGSSGGMNCVLLVSNLNEEKVNPDALFTLFGVYGDVIRVKIMFNKKDTALIQFTDGHQAQTAIDNLQNIRVWDKPLKLSFSKHSQVQMPKEGSDQGYTKDFTGTPLHRFKKPNSKNFQNIFPPSTTLHLSNLPNNTSEDELRDLFEDRSYRVMAFKFMQKERKMALMQLESIEAAVHALVELHNHPMSDSAHLRVSFSKASI